MPEISAPQTLREISCFTAEAYVKVELMQANDLDFLKRLAHGVAAQFGSNCEVVVHDLQSDDPESTIVVIENGQVSGRKVGDGPSPSVLEMLRAGSGKANDRYAYLTKADNGKILKCTTILMRDNAGVPAGIFGISYDISLMLSMEGALHEFASAPSNKEQTSENAMPSIMSLLDELIEQSVCMVGKPVALMTREDKVKAIAYLNESGAFLVTKAGQKVCKYFGISKYTLYSYIDEATHSVQDKA